MAQRTCRQRAELLSSLCSSRCWKVFPVLVGPRSDFHCSLTFCKTQATPRENQCKASTPLKALLPGYRPWGNLDRPEKKESFDANVTPSSEKACNVGIHGLKSFVFPRHPRNCHQIVLSRPTCHLRSLPESSFRRSIWRKPPNNQCRQAQNWLFRNKNHCREKSVVPQTLRPARHSKSLTNPSKKQVFVVNFFRSLQEHVCSLSFSQ